MIMNKTVLLHICCGPCATYPLEELQKHYDVRGFFCNPNIHPYREWQRRLNHTKKVAEQYRIPLETVEEYPLETFLQNCLANPQERCTYCYTYRLEETAKRALDLGISMFTTTLLISPYQNRDAILSIGETLAKRKGLQFQGFDFRPGFSRSRVLAKELNLYRQGYCGCVFSEKDRYFGRE